MAKNKLLIPKGYLSWSAIDMWKRAPYRYVKNYMLGDRDPQFEGYNFGKIVSDSLETGEDTDDDFVNLAIQHFPKYDIQEHIIKAPFKSPYGEVVLLGKLDTFRKSPPAFREYKTGKSWTQRKAENHKQLVHYATLIWLTEGRVPVDCYLDWLETERLADGPIYPTGKPITSFKVSIGLSEVLGYLAEVSKIAKEIDQEYRRQLAKIA